MALPGKKGERRSPPVAPWAIVKSAQGVERGGAPCTTQLFASWTGVGRALIALIFLAQGELVTASATEPAAPAAPAEGAGGTERTDRTDRTTGVTGGQVDPRLDWHIKAGQLIERNWGVDIIGIHRVSSGYMLRLSYRVVDPVKAKPLFDKTLKPYVIDRATGARLAVPALENVGELRQTGKPVSEQTYFVIFGNPDRLVPKGGQVDLVIGNLTVDGLTVD